MLGVLHIFARSLPICDTPPLLNVKCLDSNELIRPEVL